MRIGRSVPPAAAPFGWQDLGHAVAGAWSPVRAIHAREEEIREHFGVPHVFLVSSGTAALTVTLAALKSLSSKTEVVIPAFTCFSVPAAVLKAGLRPVLCDIDPATFDFDHALLEQTLTDNTLCVVAHHLFAIPSDIARLKAMCQPRGIVVVEDAAQAMGVRSGAGYLGTLGDVGIFSLGRGKTITCGSGGIVITRSDRIADAVHQRYLRLRFPSRAEMWLDFVRILLMAVFIRPSLYWVPAAMPFLRLGETIFPKDVPLRLLSGLKAGFLRHWRRRLHDSIQIRSETAADFSRQLSLHPVHGPAHPYLRLPVLAATPGDKDRIHALSRRLGLGMSVAYPTSVNEIRQISAAFHGREFPNAKRVAEHLLTIPTHHWLSEADRCAIVTCLATAAPDARPPGRWASPSSVEVVHHG
ncbi:MAG TPA: DegT/DnrJ/EryC1/StrS family aminotransferase [Vicinamibacterales bacterium]|nr:DegT/DnrJ/EryC1/StrS family aminotransferase [Vicinamibacterales bacterium]